MAERLYIDTSSGLMWGTPEGAHRMVTPAEFAKLNDDFARRESVRHDKTCPFGPAHCHYPDCPADCAGRRKAAEVHSR